MEQQKIIVFVEHGIVQAVFSSDPDMKVILYDVDNIKEGDKRPIPGYVMDDIFVNSTENCAVETKYGKFYHIY